MKICFFLLSLTITAIPAFAIDVPDSAIIKNKDGYPAFTKPNRATRDGYPASRVPLTGGIDEYTLWAEKLLNEGRTHMLRKLATDSRDAAEKVKCIGIDQAIDVDSLGDNQYRVTCFAGPYALENAKEITHVLEYRIKTNYIPSDCASTEKVRSFFSNESNRNEAGAKRFLQFIEGSCRLQVMHVNPSRPVVNQGRSKVSPDWLLSELNKSNRNALQGYVNRSSKETKKEAPPSRSPAYEEDMDSNPLRRAD